MTHSQPGSADHRVMRPGWTCQAADDLGEPAASRLYPRLLAWTMRRGEACQVCGSRRHVLVAGIPPRLVPCPDLGEVIEPVCRPPDPPGSRARTGRHPTRKASAS